jgi:hypothetical protein
MSENKLISDKDAEGPIFSATKYEEYHVTLMSMVDDDIEM